MGESSGGGGGEPVESVSASAYVVVDGIEYSPEEWHRKVTREKLDRIIELLERIAAATGEEKTDG